MKCKKEKKNVNEIEEWSKRKSKKMEYKKEMKGRWKKWTVIAK